MDSGVSLGILTSKELLLSLAGSEVSIGRYAIREKNLTEVVETIQLGIARSEATCVILEAKEKSEKMAEKDGDADDNKGWRRWTWRLMAANWRKKGSSVVELEWWEGVILQLILDMLVLWMGGKEQGSVSGFCSKRCWMGYEQSEHTVIG